MAKQRESQAGRSGSVPTCCGKREPHPTGTEDTLSSRRTSEEVDGAHGFDLYRQGRKIGQGSLESPTVRIRA